MHLNDLDEPRKANNINNDKLTLYFRAADKISYRYQIDEETDLDVIRQNVARKKNNQKEKLKFMCEGKEFQDFSQLDRSRKVHIIHIVNIQKIMERKLNIVVNFQNRFKDSFQVESSWKIQQLVDQINKQKRIRITQLVCLGKMLRLDRSFEEEFIEDGTQLYAVNFEQINELEGNKATIFIQGQQQRQGLIQGNTSSSSFSSQITTQKSISLANDQSDIQLANPTLSRPSNAPISLKEVIQTSNCFDVHGQQVQRFDTNLPTCEQQNTSAVGKIPSFNSLIRRSINRAQVDLRSSDILFYGYEELPQIQNFLSKGISQFRQLNQRR